MSTPPSSSSLSPSFPSGDALVGRKLEKYFYEPAQQGKSKKKKKKRRRRLYEGVVKSYDAERDVYKIVYPEDDDREEMGWDELSQLLLLMDDDDDDEKVGLSITASSKNPKKQPRRVVTPQSDDDDVDMDMEDDEEASLLEDNDEDSLYSEEEEEEEEDEESLQEDEDDDDDDESFEVKKPRATKKKTTVTRKTLKKNFSASSKKRSSKKELFPSSPNTKKKKPTKKRGSVAPTTRGGSASSSILSANAIANRGLPKGSRAVGRGGFEVRTLDGIEPLLTTENVTKAIKLVGTRQYQEAARLLRTEADSIRAFCKAACKILGINHKANNTTSIAGVSLEGGSGLSKKAETRLKEGTAASIVSNLPGRLLVVRAGTAVDDETGEPLCPPELVDQVFDSAKELHTQIRGATPLATYAMRATGDPAFGSWSRVVKHRLDSAGLLPSGNPEDDTPNMRPKRPFVVTIQWKKGENNDLPVGSWRMYSPELMEEYASKDEQAEWALLEGVNRDVPPLILGVSPSLIAADDETNNAAAANKDDDDLVNVVDQKQFHKVIGLLPTLSSEVSQVLLPASQLQKAIRRNFCSAAPVLEACHLLLYGETRDGEGRPPRGGVFEMLRTTWRCMLEDASPFDAPKDGSILGIEELMLLSLIAAADPSWTMPPSLSRKAVAAAIRTQKQPANFTTIKNTPMCTDLVWKLQEMDQSSESCKEGRVLTLRNALLVMQAAIGGKLVHRSSIDSTDSITDEENTLLDGFEQFNIRTAVSPDSRLQKLDDECRLASYDLHVSPAGLLLLQATLSEPPASWKKHSLPALARHVSQLVTRANARLPNHHSLTRLAAWGRNSIADSTIPDPEKTGRQKMYSSAREVVTSTGMLSDKEKEIIDCYEAVQLWRLAHMKDQKREIVANSTTRTTARCSMNAGGSEADTWTSVRAEVGAAPQAHDGRIAFLLAFAKAEEIEVHPEGGDPEVVNVLFCGDSEEPLLVQRIGEAREKAAIAVQGPESGASGAKAVPSLGYLQRKHDKLLMEAAERAVARSWKGGRVVSLPLPPPGFQWNLSKSDGSDHNEQDEESVKLTATLSDTGVWHFTIGGISVDPFDARNVISPCSLDTHNHQPQALGPECEDLLRTAFYIDDAPAPSSVLFKLERLHELAVDARRHTPNEGHVYDWIPLATAGRLSAHIWRDSILALKTREKDDVVLGPVQSNGKCNRDMTEGCLYRVFSALEMLYPTALIKRDALKWRVRPRGAQYHHMLFSLDQLSRGLVVQHAPPPDKMLASSPKKPASKKQPTPTPTPTPTSVPGGSTRKRPRRHAADACRKAVTSMASSDTVGHDCDSSDETEAVPEDESEDEEDCEDFLPLPQITTKLWDHQQKRVETVVSGVKAGKRGHADASAVGSGKTLTALATIVRLAAYMEENHDRRSGVLVMLPTKALVTEWLLQIALHTSGFHVIEQREDGQLHSLTYGKSTPPPPIDGNSLVITTLDRVRAHPFTRQTSFDFVVIDECLAIQNATAKRCPSAWRQIEVSTLGVLMLSATFFRSKYSDLFYMIRMLRTAFPREMEWLSATIHEHIVCQVPETDRTWELRGEPVPLPDTDLEHYRDIISQYGRKQLNNSGKFQDFQGLKVQLEEFLRRNYEGRDSNNSYDRTSVMAEACFEACSSLLKQNFRPLVFADTLHEAEHFLRVLRSRGLNACKWDKVARNNVPGVAEKPTMKHSVIVAVKTIQAQGINMQDHADAIVCRPTPGDQLEQMKGRIDRPGQTSKKLVLVVLMAEHTLEEAKFANIHLAGNFFREFIAPVASRYRERIDLEATLAAAPDGNKKLVRGTVSAVWRRTFEAAGQSAAFARDEASVTTTQNQTADVVEVEDGSRRKRTRSNNGAAREKGGGMSKSKSAAVKKRHDVSDDIFVPLNKVIRNKGDPVAVREAKQMAKKGKASLAVRRWLFPPKKPKPTGLPKESLLRFSDAKPATVLDRDTIHKAVAHLSKDKKLAALISRVGVQSLVEDCGDSRAPTQARLFNHCVRAICFTMVSVPAGNVFMKKLAIKIGACIETMTPSKRAALLKKTIEQMQEGTTAFNHLTTQSLLKLMLDGRSGDVLFTADLLGALVETCILDPEGQQSGYPHICGLTEKCGKNDDPKVFLQKARAHAAGDKNCRPVSAGFSAPKARFLISLVNDFKSGKISAKKIAQASDREAAKMLLALKGIGDWSVGGILMNNLKRANIMLYGDLTLRNMLNDLYKINSKDDSETMLESSANFPDNRENRNLMDAVAKANGWEPYRSVVALLMYHLQEENLVLV